MSIRRQHQASYALPILSMVLSLPALLYILAGIAFQIYKVATGFNGQFGVPSPLLDFGLPQQLVTRLFGMYLVCGPLFGFLLSFALRSESRRDSPRGVVQGIPVHRLNTAALLLCALTIVLLSLTFVAHAIAG